MPSEATADSWTGNPQEPLRASRTPSQALSATPLHVWGPTPAQRPAPGPKRRSHGRRKCDDPVVVSNTGLNWHNHTGTPACRRCKESSRLYAIFSRLRRFGRCLLGIEDLVEFARAWEQLPDDKDRPMKAAEAMIEGMSRL